tara:strand:+ start:148 stop:675 length:528 start_codon:yes stop_codon:yes gene_type:complete
MLIIMSGLPGTGKTTIAQALCRHLVETGASACYLRIDTIEAALSRCTLKIKPVEDAGYEVAYGVAEDNLRLGQYVIADSVNPIALTRTAWHDVAKRADARSLDIVVTCSDPDEHQRRVIARYHGGPAMVGHEQPDWADVTAREYDDWQSEHLLLDTAVKTPDDCITRIMQRLGPI